MTVVSLTSARLWICITFFVTHNSSRSSWKIPSLFRRASVLLSVFAKSSRNFGARTIRLRERRRNQFDPLSESAGDRISRGTRTLRGTRNGTTHGACRACPLAQAHKYLCAMDERTKPRWGVSLLSVYHRNHLGLSPAPYWPFAIFEFLVTRTFSFQTQFLKVIFLDAQEIYILSFYIFRTFFCICI